MHIITCTLSAFLCRSFRNAKWPTFWLSTGPQGLHRYDLRLLFDAVPMQWDWPVAANLHEGQAFATWKALKTGRKLRVLSELEHQAIRDQDQRTGRVDPVMAYESTASMADKVSHSIAYTRALHIIFVFDYITYTHIYHRPASTPTCPTRP